MSGEAVPISELIKYTTDVERFMWCYPICVALDAMFSIGFEEPPQEYHDRLSEFDAATRESIELTHIEWLFFDVGESWHDVKDER